MSKQSPSATNKVLAAGTALIFGAFFLLSLTGLLTPINNAVYDFLVNLRINYFAPLLSPRIVPVDLNDRAERNLGGALDNRAIFADLFSVLSESDVTAGMDFLFSGGKDPAVDKRMAQEASYVRKLVLAIVPLDAERTRFSGEQLEEADLEFVRKNSWHPQVKNAGAIPHAASFLLPNRALAQNSAFLGHIGVSPDRDGVYRKTWLFYRFEGGYVPALALAMLAAELKIDTSKVIIDAGKKVVLPLADGGQISIPVDLEGSALIPYPSHWLDGWKRIPLDKFLNASYDDDVFTSLAEAVYGATIVVSDVTTAAKDFGITPFDGLYPLSGIHTSLLNAAYTDGFFAAAGRPLQLLLFAVTLSACLFAVFRKKDTVFHGAFALVLLIFLLATFVLWTAARIAPWFAVPVLGILFSWLFAFSLRLFQLYKQKLLMQNALSRYFPRSLATRILAENRADLKPANKELTILFSDIAGFTKWSSDKSPEVVHGFLSDYLTAMSEIIFDYGGTVDKFIGDGMLAFFGDPFDLKDHADRALHAALAMQKKAAELREKWLVQAEMDLKIRIGINSGNVIVGNLGSAQRIEYTVIGAAVNLASRMESNAPIGGILVCEQAKNCCTESFSFTETRLIEAKGYAKSVKAFVLTE